jgi:hypothetical protein
VEEGEKTTTTPHTTHHTPHTQPFKPDLVSIYLYLSW